MKKLAIVITHPIQYYTPVFSSLAQQCQLMVFYTWGKEGIEKKYDPGFDKTIDWDLPLLEDYNYEIVENIANEPGSHHGKGIINPNLINQINTFNPSAMLVYGYIYQSHFKLMRHFKGKIPIWFRGDSNILNLQPRLKSIAKKIYLNWVYSFVDKAFYVGTNNKVYFKKYGLKENQLIFAPHAIDNKRFSEERTTEVQELKKKLGYTTEDIILLYAGKFEDVKNLELLLTAFNALNTVPNLRLLLVGNGPQELKLKNLAKENSRIQFLDFQNQFFLPVIYQLCDVFCLPSTNETWGLGVNEAMAAGKAVIVSDKVGCHSDLVINGINGYVFSSNDVTALKNTIAMLTKDPQQIVNFGKTSKEIIQNWSFQKQVTSFIKALNATN